MTTQTRKQIPTAAAIAIGFLGATAIFAVSMAIVSIARESTEAYPSYTFEHTVSEGVGETKHIEASDVTRYLYVLVEGKLSHAQIINPGEDLTVFIDSDQQFVVTETPLAEFPNPVIG